MHTKRRIALTAAVALSATPMLCSAGNASRAVAEACAQAFVATLASPGKPAPALKGTRIVDMGPNLGSASEVQMTATSTRSHMAVARATCLVGADGTVQSITAVPLANW